jgi:hypothetical protein
MIWRFQSSACVARVAEMKMVDKIEQSDRTLKSNHKPESCYCSALPKGRTCAYPAIRYGWPQVLVSKAASRYQRDMDRIEQPHRSDMLLSLLILLSHEQQLNVSPPAQDFECVGGVLAF